MARSDRLSDFELYVMLAVAALGDNAYGVSILTRIEERAARTVSIGAVYATLGRLEEKGFVAFHISDPEPVPGGRSRKLVTLTAAGARALRQTTDALLRMLDGAQFRPAGNRQ